MTTWIRRTAGADGYDRTSPRCGPTLGTARTQRPNGSSRLTKANTLLSAAFTDQGMDAFYALAEPRRRRVVEILAHRGQLSATEISDEFDVTPQAISQHLRVLREANVVLMEKRAQQRMYAFNPRSVNPIVQWSATMAKSWTRRLDRLDKALREETARATRKSKK